MQRSKATTVIRAAVRANLLKKWNEEAGLSEPSDVETGDSTEPLLDGPTSPRGGPSNGGASHGGPSQPTVTFPVNCGTPVGPSARTLAAAREWTSSRRTSIKQLEAALPWWRRDYMAAKSILFSSWFNVMLVCLPLGLAAHFAHWPPVAVFTLNFLTLIPLALILGDITEDLALRFGDVVGGLLNATFGNVVELLLSISALQNGLYTVVATSLLGSILSNLLLVLGCCFLFGGCYYKTQTFNEVASQATGSLLFLSCIGIILPTAAKNMMSDSTPPGEDWVLAVSRGTAIVLLIIYGCYLYFQLKTHKDTFAADEDAQEPALSLFGSLLGLSIITIVVATCSEFLTGSIEAFSETTGIGQAFLGMIVLPIAGNACEHITAVIVAMKNKMDLALGVAVGSSTQIALFAIPFVVLVGWATGHPFSLDFDPFATVVLTVSVILANFITSNASSNWLLGMQLIATYTLISVAFIYR